MGVTNYLLTGMILQVHTTSAETLVRTNGLPGGLFFGGRFVTPSGDRNLTPCSNHTLIKIGRVPNTFLRRQKMSSVENPGWLFDIGDDKLPNYMGIIISQYKDPKCWEIVSV